MVGGGAHVADAVGVPSVHGAGGREGVRVEVDLKDAGYLPGILQTFAEELLELLLADLLSVEQQGGEPRPAAGVALVQVGPQTARGSEQLIPGGRFEILVISVLCDVVGCPCRIGIPLCQLCRSLGIQPLRDLPLYVEWDTPVIEVIQHVLQQLFRAAPIPGELCLEGLKFVFLEPEDDLNRAAHFSTSGTKS